MSRPQLLYFFFTQLGLSAELHAPALGIFYAFVAALSDEVSFKFGYGTQQVKSEPSSWCGGVYGLIENYKANTFARQGSGNTAEIAQRTRQTVKFGDGECITLAHEFKRLRQLWAVYPLPS
jgi:hypothetical protein